jgi:hypothetical protein
VRPGAGFFSGSGFEDLLNDPAFQNFFGRSSQRDVTVSSAPETFTVLPLPAEGRPADFSGAVGKFAVSTDLSQDKAGVGDPITLRTHVSGEGDFARVDAPVLHDGDGWKAYTPTSKFTAADEIGYRGEKTFEQPLVSTRPGERAVPETDFSWFDPATRRYEQAHTPPLTVAIAPAPAGSSLASMPPAASPGAAAPTGNGQAPAWRPDHPDRGAASSLTPHYFQPEFVALPPLLLVALSTAWLWIRQGERSAKTARSALAAPPSIESLANQMDGYAAAGDTESFFDTGRAALRRVLATKWGLAPTDVTAEEVISRLGSDSEISRAFLLADEATYSRLKLSAPDFQQWKRIVLRNVDDRVPT